ncbi:PREDICTED: nuclear pore membrane glycoprotein 210-like [Amphimedon queenslandica]|uniref:BIG2 domain-containing protein n=1 Tax=Amphimedon queenslandica TaxID=400682 RepID=A0A1X7V6B1_AMPQE|nr:PREDICTED: nuclear pore membrane glycoprotein 210-like [Amphimedon queenslandica]|eukprot:XP_019850496.1 PREDICTED: nuclear pore membrane glycoprotein 210-like [Amphimedon queenslandica]
MAGRNCTILPLLLLSLLLVLSFIDTGASKQYTLNVPRVLLPRVPPSGVKSNFTLKSDYGCFNWISTKPDVASVHPVYMVSKTGLKCSREAVLTPQSTDAVRLSTIIIATEEVTGLTLRCDVYVDTISRIEITTRTRELLLEEEPEKFEVRAFDDEGNMFSTVRGHVFQWTLLKDEDAESQQLVPESILSFVEFRDSSYSVDPIISSIEDEGQQGDEVLVSGINTGTAKVCVKLAEKIWKSVAVDVVKLLVIENLMLLPSADVYIMPYSYVDYRVERRKHGKVEVVSMPSEQYSLELLNSTVASLDRAASRVTGMVIGSTEIVLHDKNMLNIPHAAKPSADIHVVFPHHIDLDVLPGHQWVLQVGKQYVFIVNLKDTNNHKILITKNVLLVTEVSSDYFSIHYSTANGSYHSVTADEPGKTYLNASINQLKHPETDEVYPLPVPLFKKQLIEIFHPITVMPGVLLLLWDSKNEYQYKHQLKVIGGSGSYQWTSDNVDVVGVSNSGLITSFTIGQANVTASDTRNSDHYDTAKVYVVPPIEMSFISSRVEIEVGGSLYLPLQVLGRTLDDPPMTLPFYDCRFMGFQYSLADEAIFNISIDHNISLSSLPPDACTFIKATSIKPGHTKLTLTYTHGLLELQASVTIAAYPVLRSIDPEDFVLVTLGSSKTVVLEGGPSSWVLDPSKYFRKLVPEVPDAVSIRSIPSSSLTQHEYLVVCKKLGEQTLVFTVGNGPTSKNKIPADETIAIKYLCSLPTSVSVRPLSPEMTDCPLLREGNLDTQHVLLSNILPYPCIPTN